jgi:hypothetical protein
MRVAGLRTLLLRAVQSLVPVLARRLQACRSLAIAPLAVRRAKPSRSLRQRGARFEQLERREVFNATYHGGVYLPHPEVQGVYLGSDWNSVSSEATFKTSLDSYLSYLVQSPFMDNMTDHSYNVGQGTASKGVVLPFTLNKTNAATGGVSDADIESVLQSSITARTIDQPTKNKIYVVFVEQGVVIHAGTDTSATTFLGYHSAFAGRDASNVPFDIHYAVIAFPNDTAATGFNPTAASQGFGNEYQLLTLGGTTGGSIKPTFGTNTSEVQTLTVGGADGGKIVLSFNGTAGTPATQLTVTAGISPSKDDVLAHLNSISALSGNVDVTGDVGGPFTITFKNALANQNVAQLATVPSGGATATVATATNGSAVASATINITRTDEIQTLAVGGTDGSTIRLGYNNVAGTEATELVVQAGTSPTAAQVQAQLESIADLSSNVKVTGSDGGPFSITFLNGLTGVNVAQLVGVLGDGATATIDTQTSGSMPTAAQVLASVNSITGLTNNISVAGNDGGPFTIEIRLGNVSPIGITPVSGGLTGTISTRTDGETVTNGNFDQLTFTSSHEIAESATDPDANYKTAAWYDAANGNIEIADLTLDTSAQFVDGGTRLNGYLTTNIFDQQHNVVPSDATSTAFPGRIAADNVTITTSLENVTATRLSLSQVRVSWTPVPGAVGYRVFLVNGTTSTLLSRVQGTQSSTVLTGLQQLQKLTFRVEAYNAANITDPVTVSMTLPLPNLTAPQHVVASKNPASNTSAILTWNQVDGAAGYRVFLINGTRKTLLATLGEGVTTSTINGLAAGTTVSFRVEAFRGSKIADSALASVTLNRPSLAVPVVTIQAVNGNISVVQLSWNAVNGAKGYRIYYVNSRGARVLLSTLDATKLTSKISGLPAHTQFIVEAFSGSVVAASKPVKL